jgi:hypothetical protein
MKKLLISLLSVGFALGAQADHGNQDIVVEQFTDFVAVDRMDASRNLKIVLVGPDGYRRTISHAADEAAYIETRDAEGSALADGLYRYEAWTEPRKLVSRSPDDPRAGRDAGLDKATEVATQTVSGGFLVVDGVIVDPNLEETPVRPVGQVQP